MRAAPKGARPHSCMIGSHDSIASIDTHSLSVAHGTFLREVHPHSSRATATRRTPIVDHYPILGYDREVRLLVAALVAWSGTAQADPRVAVMPLRMTGQAAPDLEVTLEASFVGGLATAGLTVVAPSEIRTSHPRFADCRAEGCSAALI